MMPTGHSSDQRRAMRVCLVVSCLAAALVIGLVRAGAVPTWAVAVAAVPLFALGAVGWLIVLRRGTMSKRQTATVLGSPDECLAEVAEYFRRIGATVVARSADRLVAETSSSFVSFGEQITVRVEALDARATTVTVTSTSSLPTAIDFGKNGRNVQHVLESLALRHR
jgi:hypothetical protein